MLSGGGGFTRRVAGRRLRLSTGLPALPWSVVVWSYGEGGVRPASIPSIDVLCTGRPREQLHVARVPFSSTSVMETWVCMT
jgi:hypothetical protein